MNWKMGIYFLHKRIVKKKEVTMGHIGMVERVRSGYGCLSKTKLMVGKR